MAFYPRGIFQVWLCDPYGLRLALLPQASIGKLNYSRTNPTQQVGQFSLSVPARYDDMADFGYLVDIWRAPLPGMVPRHESTYLLEDRSRTGRERTWQGEHINKMLKARIVNADRGETGADKTGPADNVAKAYVREGMGSAAGTTRDLGSAIPFTVETDYSLGPTITKEAGRANLLDTVQQIQRAAMEQQPSPAWLMWEITPTGHDLQFALEFRTWVNWRTYRGMASAAPLVLSEYNCLSQVTRERVYSRSYTTVIVGAQGTGNARTEAEIENTRYPSRPGWWRREAFVDAGQTTDAATMQEKGYRKLREGLPVDRISATLRPHPAIAYGLNLDLGDMVVIQDDQPFDVRVESVVVSADAHSEKVAIKLEGEINA